MNKRSLQKEKTRKLILETCRQLFLENGYVFCSTKALSDSAKVSQGSIFMHFQTKDNLLEEMIKEELSPLISSLDASLFTSMEIISLMGDHFDLLSRMAKDIAFLPVSIRALFLQVRTMVKDQLYDALQKKSKLDILSMLHRVELVFGLMFEDMIFEKKSEWVKRKKKYHMLLEK